MYRQLLSRDVLPALAVDAEGEIIFRMARDVIRDAPIGDQIDLEGEPVVDVRFELPDHPRIPIGSAAELLFEAEASATLTFAGEKPGAADEILARYALDRPDSEHVLLILEAKGLATAAVGGNFPVGTFAFGVNAAAGGDVRYVHARPYHKSTSTGDVFESFLRTTILPYGVTNVASIPLEGEVVAFEYGGYLSLGVSAAWGYSVTKYKGAALGKLSIESTVDVASALKLEGGVRLAGDFVVEVRRGRSAEWARVTVRKKRERAFTFAGSLSVGIDVQTEGLPQDADQFLEAALDLRTPQIAMDLRDILEDGEDALIERLRQKKDALLEKLVGDLSEKYLQKALTSEAAGALFGRLKEVIALYDELDARAVSVLEWIVERGTKVDADLDDILDELEDALNSIVDATTLKALKAIDDPLVWDLLKRYVGEDWLAFLTDEDRFADVRDKITRFKAAQWKKIGEFIKIRYDSIGLKSVMADLGALVDQLRSIDEPEEAVEQAEKYLLALAERLTGQALERLRGKELRQALSELDEVLGEVEDFKTRIYAQFKETLNRSHKLAVARSFARTQEDAALVDVEFDLSSERGRALMRQAVRGEFQGVFDDENLAVLTIHEAAFTHRTTTRNQLKLDLFGWTRTSVRQLVTESETTVRQEGDGLLHLHALSSDEEVSRKEKGEEFKLNFILNLLASGTRQDVVESVERMSAEYTVGVEDRRTSEKELRRYLSLGQELGILPQQPEAFIASLREEFGKKASDDDWGKVSLKYDVRWASDALLRIVEIPLQQMIFMARDTLARIVGGAFLSCYREGEVGSLIGRGSMWHYKVGRLLLDRDVREALRRKDGNFYHSDASFCVILDNVEHCIGGSNDRVSKAPFLVYFEAEKGIENALTQLQSNLKGGTTQIENLERVFAQFAEQRHRLARAMPKEGRDRFTDPFFAILDRLVMLMEGPQATRSVLELTLHRQEHGRDAGITKIYA